MQLIDILAEGCKLEVEGVRSGFELTVLIQDVSGVGLLR